MRSQIRAKRFWRATNDKCKIVRSPVTCMTEQWGVTIDRGPGGQPPPNTTAKVACNTVSLQPGEAEISEAECRAKNNL